jgi:hypothetical protein
MKKLLMLCAFVMVFGAGTAMAQNYAALVDGTLPFDSEATIVPGSQICFDVYLENAPGQATSGGVFVAFKGSTSLISYVSATMATTDNAGPWDPAASTLTNEANGVGTLQVVVGQTGGGGASPDGNGNLIVTEICLQCDAIGDANVRLTTIPGFDTWGPTPLYSDGAINAATTNPNLVIHQDVECTTDADCEDDLFCNGTGAVCIANACDQSGVSDPCDSGDTCTILPCDEDTDSCGAEECDFSQLTSSTAPCCAETLCNSVEPGQSICGAEVTLIKECGFYQPPADPSAEEDKVTIKNPVCMNNPDVLVGGIQFDLCDSPDCLECIACELTERTVLFDCATVELPNGCCRVILFVKHPGGAINPGLCDIVTIVLQTKVPYPEECNACIGEDFENIIASDYNSVPLATTGVGCTLCPYVCGDVCPPGSGTADAQDCGNGIIDIYDIMCEVQLALNADCQGGGGDPLGGANDCQAPRADVPTGFPPNCIAPDGCVDINDIMVLIDAALNRQDCCSFWYSGIIY